MQQKMIRRIKTLACAFMAFMPMMAQSDIELFPANGSVDVNPDTHLTITFADEAVVGNKGFIRVYARKTANWLTSSI